MESNEKPCIVCSRNWKNISNGEYSFFSLFWCLAPVKVLSPTQRYCKYTHENVKLNDAIVTVIFIVNFIPSPPPPLPHVLYDRHSSAFCLTSFSSCFLPFYLLVAFKKFPNEIHKNRKRNLQALRKQKWNFQVAYIALWDVDVDASES